MLPDGVCKELRFGEGDDALSLILYRTGTMANAYLNSCPHFSLPLNRVADRFLMLLGQRVMCAWHCAIFTLSDGRCLEGPAEGLGLDCVPIEVRDGAVYLKASDER